DPYYPLYGNGGYDVGHYDLALRYSPTTDVLRGVATIEATSTQALSCFSLDLVGLKVRDVTVDGAAATWARLDGRELVITPATPLAADAAFTVVIAYDGVPVEFIDPVYDIAAGFIRTRDGAIVSGEPEVSAMWFPSNDHPTDLATYTFHVTVPRGSGVVANGLPTGVTGSGRWRTHVWEATDPMASYLATVNIGDWDMRFRETATGLPVIDAVDPDIGRIANAALRMQPEIVEFLEGRFGPYPFESVGAIVPDSRRYVSALETQTRPIYTRYVFPDFGVEIVVHEIAHQWFGDLVTLERWQHMWLNEGFATYAEWLWAEEQGIATTQETLEAVWAGIPPRRAFWNLVIGDPTVQHLFDGPVYARGAMTVQALRNAVGDDDFWAIVDAWLATNEHASGSTDEFVALAEQISGQDLSELVDVWLFTPGRPPASAVDGTIEPVRPAVAERTAAWLRSLDARHPG
ncbi:MAG: M1 family metallopeptidase, partial [Actinomycetota bacterium]